MLSFVFELWWAFTIDNFFYSINLLSWLLVIEGIFSKLGEEGKFLPKSLDRLDLDLAKYLIVSVLKSPRYGFSLAEAQKLKNPEAANAAARTVVPMPIHLSKWGAYRKVLT